VSAESFDVAAERGEMYIFLALDLRHVGLRDAEGAHDLRLGYAASLAQVAEHEHGIVRPPELLDPLAPLGVHDDLVSQYFETLAPAHCISPSWRNSSR
jgi:hypothetical protein